jgi:hypothetical protein
MAVLSADALDVAVQQRREFGRVGGIGPSGQGRGTRWFGAVVLPSLPVGLRVTLVIYQQRIVQLGQGCLHSGKVEPEAGVEFECRTDARGSASTITEAQQRSQGLRNHYRAAT